MAISGLIVGLWYMYFLFGWLKLFVTVLDFCCENVLGKQESQNMESQKQVTNLKGTNLARDGTQGIILGQSYCRWKTVSLLKMPLIHGQFCGLEIIENDYVVWSKSPKTFAFVCAIVVKFWTMFKKLYCFGVENVTADWINFESNIII